jgi:hypothetical protein
MRQRFVISYLPKDARYDRSIIFNNQQEAEAYLDEAIKDSHEGEVTMYIQDSDKTSWITKFIVTKRADGTITREDCQGRF